MIECNNCGWEMEEHEAHSFIGYDDLYCQDCYNELLSEEEKEVYDVCDDCGKILYHCTCR